MLPFIRIPDLIPPLTHPSLPKDLDSLGRRLALHLWLISTICWWVVGAAFSAIWWRVNADQFRWVVICYVWEVPVVGWLGVVGGTWLLWRRMVRRHKAGHPEVTRDITRLPRRTGLLALAVSSGGYTLGAVQLRLLAALPYVEASKVLVQGVVLGVILGAAAYLLAEAAIRHSALPVGGVAGTGLYGRLMVVGAAVALGFGMPMFLLGLTQEQARLEAIRGHQLDDILAATAGDAEALTRALGAAGGHTTAFVVDRATGRIVAGAGAPMLLEDAGIDDIGRILTGPDGWFTSRQRLDQVVATRSLAGARPPGLVLVAVSPFRDYARDLERTALLALAALVVAMAIGFAVLRALALSLVRPLARIRDVATEMASGKIDVVPVAYPGTDEIAALASAFDRMAARVRADEQELRTAYQRLISTQAELLQEAKLSSVGRLVSGVAHELNNPLTAILHLTDEVAAIPHLDAEDRELLLVVHQQAQRARAIVRDLLAAVRGRDVRRERVPLKPLVLGVVARLQNIANGKGPSLVADLPDDLPDLDADPTGVEQVLVNLIQNGAQSAGPGGIVTVRIRAIETGVCIVVDDSGAGMAPEVLPRIFEPFFTTKREGEGTGLGLFVTLGIVEAHGGTIHAENLLPPGTGARFTIVFPSAGPAVTDAPVVDAAPAPPSAATGRILIVEDEPAIRLSLRRWFIRRGWDVVEAVDGDDGLAQCLAAAVGAYDLVLTDLKMPGLSGVDLVDRLAIVRPDLHSRVIIMTGDVASPDVAALIGRTDRPIVEKPFSFNALTEVVGRVVAGKK
ncbi:MAG TPA: hybrid sensor histidine kinase/response regulator [Gemmatimonadales bacterium]|nr:hybrid sensor histidine kinase/response regulator [Gemmatimonadales bacterium]